MPVPARSTVESILSSDNRAVVLVPSQRIALTRAIRRVTIFQVPDLLGTIANAFWLVVWFSFVPVGLGLIVASVIHRVATGRLGAIARTALFLPQVIPLVAAGIIWGWLLALPGRVNLMLKAAGLGAFTRA